MSQRPTTPGEPRTTMRGWALARASTDGRAALGKVLAPALAVFVGCQPAAPQAGARPEPTGDGTQEPRNAATLQATPSVRNALDVADTRVRLRATIVQGGFAEGPLLNALPLPHGGWLVDTWSGGRIIGVHDGSNWTWRKRWFDRTDRGVMGLSRFDGQVVFSGGLPAEHERGSPGSLGFDDGCRGGLLAAHQLDGREQWSVEFPGTSCRFFVGPVLHDPMGNVIAAGFAPSGYLDDVGASSRSCRGRVARSGESLPGGALVLGRGLAGGPRRPLRDRLAPLLDVELDGDLGSASRCSKRSKHVREALSRDLSSRGSPEVDPTTLRGFI